MTRMSPRAADDHFDAIAAFNVNRYRTRFAQAQRRDTHTTGPDGYPATTISDGAGDGTSSTERAAITTPPKDIIREHVTAAEQHLAAAVKGLDGLRARLDAIDTIGVETIEIKHCQSCIRAGIETRRDKYGSVGGRLATPQHLCAGCYSYALEHGTLPTHEQLRHHNRTGTWRQHI